MNDYCLDRQTRPRTSGDPLGNYGISTRGDLQARKSSAMVTRLGLGALGVLTWLFSGVSAQSKPLAVHLVDLLVIGIVARAKW